MQFGIFDHMEQLAPRPGEGPGEGLGALYEERLRMLEFADAAGFARYHKAEHHFTVLDSAPSAMLFFAAASQRTKRIRLGSLASLLPFYHPLRLIEEICAIDHLTGGRLDIGAGKGISPVEHVIWGNDPDAAAARTVEALTILRSGLTSSRLDHAGPGFAFQDAPLVMAPVQKPHPPIWWPGNAAFAASHRLNTVVAGPQAAVKAQVARYRELVAACEDDWNPGVARPIVGAMRHIYVGPTRAAALERAREAWKAYDANLASLWRARGGEPVGSPTLDGDLDKAMEANLVVAGDADDVVAHVRSLRDEADLDYFVGTFAWGDLTHAEYMASIALFADAVVRPLSANVDAGPSRAA
ncbi:MAG TPA: LLM class flavin-dependent oxidoreductase [Caulobacteraceae bacterium]|jgi:alkanesulfonate monooxygenase SsuD/methylene tetrahydromethanopterin reductase-like flavin-dependent oxidoreductase (luciferase family)|nr:LLM class flavin-dependent oxidoreductase [Caulobacteraceae bacterium]